MGEKERLEKLESAEIPADREEDTETIAAGGRTNQGEAGLNGDGELSVEAVRRWLLWAGLALGICLAASCILGAVFLVQNRKPTVILTVDGKDSGELVLNRKGGVIRENGNPASMEGLSLRECCERLLEELHGKQQLEDQEAALFTVRPAEDAVRVDTERMAEEIAVTAELFLKARQAKGAVYAGSISEEPEVMALVRENSCSVGKAAMVQDLLERNVRVREADCGRLCQMDMGALFREMDQKNYQTSFLVATAGKLYQVKEDRPAGTDPAKQTAGESGTETDEEPGTSSVKDGTGGASEKRGPGSLDGKEPPEKAVREPQGEEGKPEEDGREAASEEMGTGEPSGEETEPGSQEPSESVPERTEATAASGTSAAAPETMAPGTSSLAPETAAEPSEPVPETSAPAAETAAPEPSAAAPGMLTPVSPTPEETPASETEAPRPPETPPATEPHTVGPGILEDVVPAG